MEESKRELDTVKQYSFSNKAAQSKEDVLRERQDYKRFFKYGEKQIVFYSEKNGFYKYFKAVIETILKKTDIVIRYITSDSKNEVFALANDNFQVYYIGDNKLNKAYTKEAMEAVRDKYLYNVTKSGEVGATYLIQRLIEYSGRWAS